MATDARNPFKPLPRTLTHVDRDHGRTRRPVAEQQAPDALPHAGLFGALDEHALAELERVGRRRSYADGAWITEAGEAAATTCLVRSGRVALYYTSAEGQEIILDTLHAGDVFGFESWEARALVSGTVVQHIPHRHMQRLVGADPRLRHYFRDVVQRRLDTVVAQLTALAWQPVDIRLAHKLAELARADPALTVTETHAALAAMIVTRQDEVSKAIGRLRRRGLIASQPYRPGLVILDVEALAAM